ncbi:glycosyltransferase family 2 protein [Cellulosilyticum ruminicola]|uniref:glycosyltransferase family 2 protein n=1 Tax=Cellulosilyticum ruminicola TaxID=425254 RepID=UPI0006CF9334|nr:glycosyltransferase family 2 protein [Cellulosilyticum ruminicola]
MITIVIPNYNGNNYLKQCIDSIYTQTYNDYELIIIDNASTDGSYEWVKQYNDINYKRLDRNYGFSRAVNEGIKLAKGEYVLLLNNDTKLCQNFLEEMLKVIEGNPRIFGVSSKMIQYHKKSLIDDAGDEYTVIGWPYKRGDGRSINEFKKEENIFSACAGAALYRKRIFDQIGYFDEKFFAYMEDIDISYRANIYGYKNVYAPRAQVYHIGSATSGGIYSEFKLNISARNSIYVPYKNMPLLQLIINLPCLVAGMLVKQRVFARKGYGQAYKDGLIEGIKTLKNIEKVPFKLKHIPNYIYIEWLLIKNTFRYFMLKLK